MDPSSPGDDGPSMKSWSKKRSIRLKPSHCDGFKRIDRFFDQDFIDGPSCAWRTGVHIGLVCNLVPSVNDECQAIFCRLGIDTEPSTDFLPKLLATEQADRVGDTVWLLKAEPAMLPPDLILEPLRAARNRDDQEDVIHQDSKPTEGIRLGSSVLVDLDHPDPGHLMDERIEGTHPRYDGGRRMSDRSRGLRSSPSGQ